MLWAVPGVPLQCPTHPASLRGSAGGLWDRQCCKRIATQAACAAQCAQARTVQPPPYTPPQWGWVSGAVQNQSRQPWQRRICRHPLVLPPPPTPRSAAPHRPCRTPAGVLIVPPPPYTPPQWWWVSGPPPCCLCRAGQLCLWLPQPACCRRQRHLWTSRRSVGRKLRCAVGHLDGAKELPAAGRAERRRQSASGGRLGPAWDRVNGPADPGKPLIVLLGNS